MEMIRKDRVATSMVRGFFDGFFSGLLDAKAKTPEEKRQPIFLKQQVAEFYGQVGNHFAGVMIPRLLAMNFVDYNAAMADMAAHRITNSTPMKLVLRHACQSKPLYDLIIAEYKEQMNNLLDGHIQSIQEHIAHRGTHDSIEEMDSDHAIRSVVRVLMHGYARGIAAAETGEQGLRQPTIFRLMVEGMATLLHDEPYEIWAETEEKGLDAVFRRVCVTPNNYETLINEMNQAHEDLSTDAR